MAYETESTPSIGQRLQGLGEGISGVAKAVTGAMDWQQRRKATEQHMAQVEQQMQMQQQQLEDMKLKGQMMAQDKIGDILFDSAMSDDPAASVRLSSPRLGEWHKYTGQPYDPKSFEQQAKDLKSVVGSKGGPIDMLQQAKSSLNITATPMAAKAAYEAGMKAIQRLSPYISSDLIGRKRDVLDQLYSEYNRYQAGLQEARTRALAPKPPKFETTLQDAQAKEFAKQLEAVPDMQQRVSNLEAMKGLIASGKVATGEISGMSLMQSLQRINTPEAQELSFLLTQEGVNAIMNFAKSAGVRSIDTEGERKYLLNSIASAKYSPKVLMEIVERTQRIINKGLKRIEQKNEYYQKHRNLSGFGLGEKPNKPPRSKPGSPAIDLHSLMPKAK